MTKESVDLPVTMSRGIELRRHSAGNVGSGNNEEKVVPHYLRASTGSCHDFCKYGRKHAMEAKEILSIPDRAGRKSLHQSSEESIGVIMTSFAKHRASVDYGQKQIRNEVLVNKNKTRRQEILSSFKVETPAKPTSKRVSTFKKEEPPLKSTSEWVKTYPKSTSQMVKTSSKSISKTMQTSSQLSSFEDKEMELSEKHVTSLNLVPVTMQKEGSFGGLKNSEIKMEKRGASLSSKPSSKKTAGINMHKSLKIVSHLKNLPKPRKVETKEHNNEAQEKTLYVIEMESENQTFQTDQNASQDTELSLSHSWSSPKFSSPSSISQVSSQEDQEESEYATSEFEEDSSSGNHEIEYMEKPLEVEENDKPQNDGIGCYEDKDCQKLRGNFVETQIEKSSPRRLQFWRGKVLGDNAIDVKVDADNIGAITSPEKVVLRHQDVQGKKDGQRLFNNVIEEAANKLIDIQKGKVKALVSAFETIISLQEKNPFANIVN